MLVFIGTALIFFLIGSFLLTIGSMKGYGMMPTLHNGDTVIIRRTKEINTMDLVAFQQGNSLQIRRVIGKPGDTVTYQDDELRINGELKNEPFIIDEINETQKNGSQYTQDFTLQTLIKLPTIPEDCYLVLGDNRPYAADSRSYGLITKEQLVGVVSMRILPFTGVRFF
ncbi:signal peptidase I [Enterococcus sp. LJL90]